MRRRPRQRRAGGAFTFVEVIVAIVVLAILAGAIALRLGSQGTRKARAELQAVEQALSSAAVRAAVSSQDVAIVYDGALAELFVQTRTAATDARRAGRVWQRDPLIAPARLEAMELVGGAADFERLSLQSFRIEFPRTGRRPDIDLRFVDERGRAWRAALASTALGAVAGPEAEVEPVLAGAVVDLDQIGQGRRPW